MKKAMNKPKRRNEDSNMRAEYDFSGGERGKFYQTMQAGYTITISKADGTIEVREVKPNRDAVILEPEVREYFPDSKAVNRALRGLIDRMPRKARSKHRV